MRIGRKIEEREDVYEKEEKSQLKKKRRSANILENSRYKKNMIRYFYLFGKLLFSLSISHNIPVKSFHFQFDPFNPSPYKISIRYNFI